MIFEIKIPDLNRSTIHAVLAQIGIYAMSFVVIAITRINYNSSFTLVQKLNAKIIWLNLGLLFCMSIIPLPTKLLGENFNKIESHLFYGSLLAFVSLFYTVLQWEANKQIDTIDSAGKSFLNRKNGFATILYGVSVPCSLVSIYISACIFILLPLLYFLSSRM